MFLVLEMEQSFPAANRLTLVLRTAQSKALPCLRLMAIWIELWWSVATNPVY